MQNGTFLDDNTEPSVLEEGLGVGCCDHSEERDKDNDATTDASTLDPTTTSPMQSILECAICMESYNIGDTIVWSLNPNCHHVFHTTCIYKWLRLKPESQWKCPYCRQSFVLPLEKTATTDT
jgi:Ring finger domain